MKTILDRTELKPAFKPNTLVSYEGGGYDGCMWEWNYAYIGKDGVFHNLASTGIHGCDTLGKLQAAYQRRPQEFDLYDFNKAKERSRAGRVLPISHLLGVVRTLATIAPDVVIKAKCDRCGKIVDVSKMVGENPHGIGGVESEYRDILCPSCRDEDEAENQDG
jgi:hypothetical protein